MNAADPYPIRPITEAALAPDAPSDPAIRLRITTPADVRDDMATVYDTVLESRPGFFARSDIWWDRVMRESGVGYTPLCCLRAEDEGGPRCYVLYAGNNRWEDEDCLPDCTLMIREIVAADPAAGAALSGDRGPRRSGGRQRRPLASAGHGPRHRQLRADGPAIAA